jgi:GTP-binding protein
VIRAQEGVDSLAAVAHRKQWRAERGQNGQGANCHGRKGEDILIPVPPGTILFDETRQITLRDLVADGDEVVVAKGGKGGRGNTHFKSAVNRAPRECEPGEPGEARTITLELKVIADVGLIGKPNAGKSTLLSRLTHARPEIADYPFTTKFPNLGRVQIDWDRTFVMADIPGLIEGAHAGVGLGHEFLRHIQRSGVLVHLVEPLPMDGTDPLQNYLTIREELTRYDAELGKRPEVVAVTKCELGEAEAVAAALSRHTTEPPLLISAVTGKGLNQLVTTVWNTLHAERCGS